MADNDFTPFTSLLGDDGPIALIIKQELAPDDEDEKIIFPPTYPITQFKGRVQRFQHGDYRVSIELPPESKRDKDEKKENQKPGYQIDRFPDGTNICEIDSIQSQSNRIEPLFKTIQEGKLVPQVTIDVGPQTVNLLDAGHRAADAVVRMSSLAPEFYDAWAAAKRGDLFGLATIAPTTLVFGAWDSRASQMKLQRLFKAHIRATNVRERTRSAQYTPAADYVALGAISEATAELKDQDDVRLSKEGGVHALSTQTVGGVELGCNSRLTRTVNINLAAIRQLRAAGQRPELAENANESEQEEARKKQKESENARTLVLREYVLGLTLLAAYSNPDLNLREGCNLQIKGAGECSLVQDRRDAASMLNPDDIVSFAKHSAERFFKEAKIDFAGKDKHGKFESGIAEEFLSLPGADRDEIRAMGPLCKTTLEAFKAKKKKREKSADPFEALRKLVDGLATTARDIFKKPPRDKLATRLAEIKTDPEATQALKELAAKIEALLTDETGAAGRKNEMLARFPGTTADSTTNAPSDAPAAEAEEAQP